VLAGASGLVGLLVAWQVAAVVLGDAVILPSVTETARSFGHYLTHPYPSQSPPLWQDLLISLRRILVGFVFGVAGGVTLGAAMFSSRTVRHLIDPVVEVIRPLPPLAFIPLFIVWFGIGELPKEVLIVFGVVPVMIIATLAALDDVPEDLNLCARTLGASRAYALWHVQIRAALPGIVTGMRIAMGGAWGSIVAAEMLAATSGVGFTSPARVRPSAPRAAEATEQEQHDQDDDGLMTNSMTNLALRTSLQNAVFSGRTRSQHKR